MNRLLVALLAAFDAVLAAAGGLAAALAPLTLLWVFGFGQAADWGTLWPASAVVWQLGHLAPVTVHLPDEYLAATGIDADAASFVISLAPLAFAVFTGLFAARSGGRAALAGVPLTGPATGVTVFAAIAAGVALTGGAELATVELWQAILFPALVFAVPCLLGAAIGAWRHRVSPMAGLRDRADRLHGAWPLVPGLLVRGVGITVMGLVGVGALVLAVAVFARGAEVVALYQAGNVDVIGAIVLAVAQLIYLPTLVGWGLSYAAGPGFAVGVGTAVSPSGTQLGVVPGIPALGLLPDSSSPWLLLLVLLPIAVGAMTGWMLRSHLVREVGGAPAEAFGPRLALLGGVSVIAGGFAALVAVVSSGAIGPDRLAVTGPAPGPLALAVGLEVAVGAGILLLSPRRGRAAGDLPPYEPYEYGRPTADTRTRAFGPGAVFSDPDARGWADSPRLGERDAAGGDAAVDAGWASTGAQAFGPGARLSDPAPGEAESLRLGERDAGSEGSADVAAPDAADDAGRKAAHDETGFALGAGSWSADSVDTGPLETSPPPRAKRSKRARRAMPPSETADAADIPPHADAPGTAAPDDADDATNPAAGPADEQTTEPIVGIERGSSPDEDNRGRR